MVDFRYHLVTIVAIFLALALGIVVGTTQLNGQVLDDLNSRVDGLVEEKRGLEQTVAEQTSRTDADEQTVAQLAGLALPGQLAGQRVVLVSAPNADGGLTDELIGYLERSGATISSRVRVGPDLIDPAKESLVQQAVTGAAPAGLRLMGTPVQQAAQELSGALLRPPPGTPGTARMSESDAERVLTRFQDDGLIQVDAQPPGMPGTVAVLLTGEAVQSADSDTVRTRLKALLDLAGELDRTGSGVVVGGPLGASAEGGLIAALRGDDGSTENISSVDGLETAQGLVAVVFALKEQAAGSAGQYGTGPGNDGPLPDPLTR